MPSYILKAIAGNPTAEPLRFDWEEEYGNVSGPGAPFILTMAKPHSRVPVHPVPNSYQLGNAPLRSRRDMAAIVGYDYVLPPELAAVYPAGDPGPDTPGIVF